MTWQIEEALVGIDAWSREARRARELTARLTLALDERQLIDADVRDLQRLCGVLRDADSRRPWVRWGARRALHAMSAVPATGRHTHIRPGRARRARAI